MATPAEINRLRTAAEAARLELERATEAYRALDQSIPLYERAGRTVDLARARSRMSLAEQRMREANNALRVAQGPVRRPPLAS